MGFSSSLQHCLLLYSSHARLRNLSFKFTYFKRSLLLQAIPSHSARRSLFEHYVKTRAEEERKEKRAAQKAAIEAFKQLLDEAVVVALVLSLVCLFMS